MADSKPRVLLFHSDAYSDDPLEVLSFRGREAISQIFRYELELASAKPDLDYNELLSKPAWLGIKHGVPSTSGTALRKTLKIHGVLSSFEQLDRGTDWVRYRAVLVPALWRLSLNVQSQIHLDRSVPEILAEELKKAKFTKDDYEFRLTNRPKGEKVDEWNYPQREYIAQYVESDLNFISRLAEHEGIFYFFEHQDDRAKIVFGDAPEAFQPIQGSSTLPYNPRGNLSKGVDFPEWFEQDVISELACRQNVIPTEVTLRDYNYRTPTDPLKVTVPVDSNAAFGTFYEYGNHYKDEKEGKSYAEIRAQEIKCRKRVFHGAGTAKAFRAGSTFTLKEHYRDDFNLLHLVTEATHTGSQTLEFAPGSGNSYRNEFTSIPMLHRAGTKEEPVVFRPERITPKPRVWTLNATVDGGGSGSDPEIDSEGRYKVKVPFDLSDRGDGKASRYVRMLTPYAGGAEGMHFPLRKGSEVVLTHMNADPDRPLIEGAAFNTEKKNVVNENNYTQCIIQTYSNNVILFENQAGNERVCISSPKAESYICCGGPDEHSPEGIRASTTSGIEMNAGTSIQIAAGSANHSAGSGNISGSVGEIHSTAATIAAGLALAGATALEGLGAGVGAIAGLAGDWGSFIAAKALVKNEAVVYAPGKTAVIGMTEAIVASVGATDVVAALSANVIGGVSALLGSLNAAGVISARKAEMVAIWGDVLIEAKKRGDVKIEAYKNVHIEAHHENVKIEAKKKNVVIEAEQDLHVATQKGKAEMLIHKNLYVDSLDDKKIEFKAGNSTITMTDDGITIQAKQIILVSKDGNNTVTLNDQGKNFDFSVETIGPIKLDTDDKMCILTKTHWDLQAKDKVSITTKKLDATGTKKAEFKEHDYS